MHQQREWSNQETGGVAPGSAVSLLNCSIFFFFFLAYTSNYETQTVSLCFRVRLLKLHNILSKILEKVLIDFFFFHLLLCLYLLLHQNRGLARASGQANKNKSKCVTADYHFEHTVFKTCVTTTLACC